MSAFAPPPSLREEYAALLVAASRVGATVRAASVVDTKAGPRLMASVDCADGWGAARLLVALAETDAKTAWARDFAEDVAGRVAPGYFVRAVHAIMRARVRFERERGEVFTAAWFTWRAGGGDCDDHARLVYAILRAGGVPVRLAFTHDGSGGNPRHVLVQAWDAGAWRWLETTIAAEYDEPPLDAARRLGIGLSREDLQASKVRTMSLSDLPPIPAGTVARSTPVQLGNDRTALRALGFLCDGAGEGGPFDPAFRRALLDFQRSRNYRGLKADGLPGTDTRRELVAALNEGGLGALASTIAAPTSSLTAHLSPAFFRGVKAMTDAFSARGADVAGEQFLAVWLAESGLRANRPNGAGAPYYGLNQMGVSELKSVGFKGTPAEWLALSAEEQLPFVRRFYEGAVRDFFGGDYSRLNGGAGQLYAINFLPARAARASDPDMPLTLREDPDLFYESNTSLDADGDGDIDGGDMKRAVARAQQAAGAYWLEARRRYYAESGAAPASGAVGNVAALLLVASAGVAWWMVTRG